MSASISALIPELQPFAQALVDLAGRAGVQPRVTSTRRSRSQQERLYAAYLRGESQYPVAPPGTSSHEYGWAFDMVADSRENLHDLGFVWQKWGGDWSPKDEVHFQYPGFSATNAVQQATGELPTDDTPWWLWSPQKAAWVCDLLAGKWYASLLALGWPESEVVKLLSKPCTEILAQAYKLGL